MTLSSPNTPSSKPAAAPAQRPLSYVAAAVALAFGVACAPAALAQSAPSSPVIAAGPVNITFGGFTELATIYRNKSESTDVVSSFNGTPLGNNEQSNASEFRFSARQSRFSMLAQTNSTNGYKLESCLEFDFLGAAPTANSNKSNSYQPR